MQTVNRNSTPRGVIVTGGGTGIGRATAREFAARGDRVLVVGRSESSLAETAAAHDDIHVMAVDLTDAGAADLVVQTAVDVLGRLDVVVNNAALAGFDTLEDLTAQDARQQVEVNLLAPVFLTQRALPALEKNAGTVVNVSSAGCLGLRAMPGSSIYAATKVGLDALTRSWAVELGGRGIRVVGISPGLVNTGVAVRAGMPQEHYDAFLESMQPRIPSGRIGTPEDVAWWIVQATAAPGGYLNGAVLAVDGGLSVT
ncbi:SDR family NAD(P)-dependent oxidoreductase [Couchioplanes azureus]|uniref:SDR family NAD(P)-dependent oxidoreductase n=1 Tax=Couchioplanes caeruleus TaxID=56438 RepID=UPI001E2E9512|nr:SDR family oxidoreductase [Couchioplanes caeruleus]